MLTLAKNSETVTGDWEKKQLNSTSSGMIPLGPVSILDFKVANVNKYVEMYGDQMNSFLKGHCLRYHENSPMELERLSSFPAF